MISNIRVSMSHSGGGDNVRRITLTGVRPTGNILKLSFLFYKNLIIPFAGFASGILTNFLITNNSSREHGLFSGARKSRFTIN